MQEIAEQEPSACDLMDRRLLSLAREADPRFEQLIAPTAEVALIVEQIGFSDAQCRDRIQMVIRAVRALNVNAVVAYQAHAFEDVEFLWTLPGKVVPLLTRLKGQTRPTPLVEDIAVPPATLLGLSAGRAKGVSEPRSHGLALFARGRRPIAPATVSRAPLAADGPKARSAGPRLVCGRFRSRRNRQRRARRRHVALGLLARPNTAQLYRVFEDIKAIFDPKQRAQPGQDRRGTTSAGRASSIRPTASVPAAEPVPLQLRWSEQALLDEALELQRLRAVQNAIARIADVSVLPHRESRRGQPPLEGQRASRLSHRPARSARMDVRVDEIAERPVLQLQAVPARVPAATSTFRR